MRLVGWIGGAWMATLLVGLIAASCATQVGNQKAIPSAIQRFLSRIYLLSVMIVFLSLVLLVGNGYPQDSPWPMFQHDAQQTGYSTDTSISVPLQQRWTYPTLDVISASPIIAGGTVFFGSGDGKFHAVDALQGNLKWEYDLGYTTVFSAAAVIGDKVYFKSETFGNGTQDAALYALNARTGELGWKVRLGPSFGGDPTSSPVEYKGIIYVGFSGGYQQQDNKMYAIDADTGNIVWQAQFPDPQAEGQGITKFIVSSPAVTETTVFVGVIIEGACPGCPTFFALDRSTGAQRWSAVVDALQTFLAPSTAGGLV